MNGILSNGLSGMLLPGRRLMSRIINANRMENLYLETKENMVLSVVI